MNRSILILITFFLLAGGCSKKSDERIILAEIGEHKISLAAFARSYINEIKYSPVDIQDSPSLRMKHLKDMITRHFLARKAAEVNLQNLSALKKAMIAESTAVIINGLYEEEIASELGEISDQALEEAYKKLGMKLHIRHLISHTKTGIDSLYFRLQHGESFMDLAKECFVDSNLMYNGGDLGYNTWGDLDIDIENEAYRLKIGDISKPIETKYGWHIIKLENILVNPILRETDFQMRKKILRQRLRHRLLKNKADLRIKKLMKSKNIRMNVPLIMVLEKEQKKLKNNCIVKIANAVEIPDQSFNSLLDSYKNETIAFYDDGDWMVSNLKDYLNTIPSRVSDGGIYRAVARSLRNYFLLQIAEKKRIEKNESVKNKINEKREHLLSSFYLDAYTDTSSFTDKDYKDYYDRVKHKRYKDKEMKVLEILVRTESRAREIINTFLDRNKDEKVFREMARQYTIRPGMKKREGYLGILRKEDLGEISRLSYRLNNGEITGPIKSDAGFSIVMVIDYKEIFTPFSEVKDEITDFMQKRKKTFVFQKMKHKYTSQPEIVIHKDLLLNAF
jgi:parvulin-like peptidyl-prolyl isomerase